jgi:hypothetical protein
VCVLKTDVLGLGDDPRRLLPVWCGPSSYGAPLVHPGAVGSQAQGRNSFPRGRRCGPIPCNVALLECHRSILGMVEGDIAVDPLARRDMQEPRAEDELVRPECLHEPG